MPLLLLILLAEVQAQFDYTANNGTITITGYNGPGGDVTIPDTINGLPVTSIGDGAFWFCLNLASVTIPNGVTDIGENTFYNCQSLTNVTIPNSVSRIGSAFADCYALSTVMIPKSVTWIGWDESYVDIEDDAFGNCHDLKGIYFEGNAPSVDSSFLFDGDTNATVYYVSGTTGWGPKFCGLPTLLWNPPSQPPYTYTTTNGTITITGYNGPGGSVTIPEAINGVPVTLIGNSAFAGCTSLTSVTIPCSVTNLGAGAFAGCTSLTAVTIGNRVTSIGGSAFQNCTSLTSVTIPNSVTSLGNYAFNPCTSLTSFYFQGNPPSLGTGVFGGNNIEVVYYLPGTTGWGAIFGGLSAVVWNPQVQTGAASFGVRTNQFGFTIIGTSSLVIVVETCTDLANPVWSPVGTNTLTGGWSYFSDSQWTNHPARFYRLRSP